MSQDSESETSGSVRESESDTKEASVSENGSELTEPHNGEGSEKSDSTFRGVETTLDTKGAVSGEPVLSKLSKSMGPLSDSFFVPSGQSKVRLSGEVRRRDVVHVIGDKSVSTQVEPENVQIEC